MIVRAVLFEVRVPISIEAKPRPAGMPPDAKQK